MLEHFGVREPTIVIDVRSPIRRKPRVKMDRPDPFNKWMDITLMEAQIQRCREIIEQKIFYNEGRSKPTLKKEEA